MSLMLTSYPANPIRQEFLILHAEEGLTVNELVDYINEILGKEIKPSYTDIRPGDIKHSLADISKAKAFGYNPIDNFESELVEVVNWFEKMMNGDETDEFIKTVINTRFCAKNLAILQN